MPYYREGPICGDRLDPGETCACKREAAGAEEGGAVMLYNGKEVLTQETFSYATVKMATMSSRRWWMMPWTACLRPQ